MPTLYVAFWPDPFYEQCVREACGLIESDHPEIVGWRIVRVPLVPYQGSFKPLDLYSVVSQDLGPVLFVGSLKQSAVSLVETKLARRVVSHHCRAVEDSTPVYAAVLDVIARHESGEPEWPLRLAVALLLVAKLVRKNYWGGTALAKNYLRVDDLANGNGLDERYKHIAHEVADFLASDQRTIRLLSKKTGDNRPKYACNSGERVHVYDFLRNRLIPDEATMKWLEKDVGKVRNSELDGISPDSFAEIVRE